VQYCIIYANRAISTIVTITPAQSRAARALLGLSQADLAAQSRVSQRTIASFETGEREPIPSILSALQSALERVGVEFIDENGGGAGVRLVKPRRKR
jgi:transcriptional regulator with XRE-family HTH domain